jgi:hypothetical protein
MADRDGFLGDYGMNNYYLYRVPENHLFHFVDWDKSEAFLSTDYGIFHNDEDQPAYARNRLWSRVMAQPDLRNYYLDVLNYCADLVRQVPDGSDPADTRGWFEREVERQYALIHDAVLTDPTQTFTPNQFEQAVADIREFVKRRPDNVHFQTNSAR